ncbi:hypothetical protein P7K49_019141 [Saguinus oedipus]|uniref:Uncharacterized protein n=1 Tax=Saguinus oedipus TaxID=9490 RepID=A0ABQ9UXM4_SAGOE|nr:hypothetical protein P7K49_019141 [Saguinus oedipus]
MVRTLFPAEREPRNTSVWSSAAVHPWRSTHSLFKDSEVENLYSALSMWLPVTDILAQLLLKLCPVSPTPFPYPVLELAVRHYPRNSSYIILANSIERKNMDILFSYVTSVTRTQRTLWKMRGQELHSIRLQGIKPSHVVSSFSSEP